MIRVELDGIPLLSGAATPVKEVSFFARSAARQTIGVAVSEVDAGPVAANMYYILRNVSISGQIIRIGDPTVVFGGAPRGMELYPGESTPPITPFNNETGLATTINAIADAAGALLDIFSGNTII